MAIENPFGFFGFFAIVGNASPLSVSTRDGIEIGQRAPCITVLRQDGCHALLWGLSPIAARSRFMGEEYELGRTLRQGHRCGAHGITISLRHLVVPDNDRFSIHVLDSGNVVHDMLGLSKSTMWR